MATKNLVVADDLADRTVKGRLRSKVIRETAAELASKARLDVTILYVKDLSRGFFKKRQLQSLLEYFDDITNSIKEQFRKKGLAVEVIIKSGSPVEEIINYIEISSKIELLVLGTQSKKGLTKILLGSVAEEVLRRTKIPALVLGPAAQERKEILKWSPAMKILLFTDFSASSEAAENEALKICKAQGCSLTLVHSVGEQIMRTRQNLYSSGYVPFDVGKLFTDMIKDAERALLRKTRRWKREGVDAVPVLISEEEPMEKTLKSLLRQNYDLIIMGTHGRNKLMTAFLGSTARQVISLSPLPVLITHAR